MPHILQEKQYQKNNNSSPECMHTPPADNKNTSAIKSRGCEPYKQLHSI